MIIIPARLNSSRFANKIMVDILGLPMVIRTARQVSNLDKSSNCNRFSKKLLI